MGEVVQMKESDATLLGYAINDLNNAFESFAEMKAPVAVTLRHMVHSILFYMEQYLQQSEENDGSEELPKPDFQWMKEDKDA